MLDALLFIQLSETSISKTGSQVRERQFWWVDHITYSIYQFYGWVNGKKNSFPQFFSQKAKKEKRITDWRNTHLRSSCPGLLSLRRGRVVTAARPGLLWHASKFADPETNIPKCKWGAEGALERVLIGQSFFFFIFSFIYIVYMWTHTIFDSFNWSMT